MNLINEKNAMFLIIDIQEKLVNMLKDDKIKKNSEILAKAANILNIPVIITEQYPKGLGNTISEIKNNLINVQYTEKTNFNACLEPNIIELIKNSNRKQIIIFGIEAHICVLQTAFDLLNRGYEIYIVEEATGSRKEENKQLALKRLIHAGCQIVTTEMVIFELLKSSKHPNFKEVQALIK